MIPLYSSWPGKKDDRKVFEELADFLDPKKRPSSVTKQLPNFKFERVTIVIAIEIDDFVHSPEEHIEVINSTQVQGLHSSLAVRVGPRILGNVRKVIVLPIDTRNYEEWMKLLAGVEEDW
jgi:hypothetical protein